MMMYDDHIWVDVFSTLVSFYSIRTTKWDDSQQEVAKPIKSG
jgi:hypothetical protein